MATPLPKLAAPAMRALYHAGLLTLEDVTQRTERDIAGLHGMGPNALSAVKKEMLNYNLRFKGEVG